jgi:putative ABC transport system substrate-binding protein
MNRRELIILLGGAAAAWPLAARAQQDGRVRRLAVLALRESPEVRAVLQPLGELGWIEGRNLRLDVRFGGGDINRTRAYAAELIKLAPDAIYAPGGVAADALREQTKSIPIIAGPGDFTERGTVENAARPEGNITGFGTFGSLGGKWLELLKEAAPHITRVIFLTREENPSRDSYERYAVAAAQNLGLRIEAIQVRNVADIKAAIERFAAEPNGALLPNPGMLAIAPLELMRLAEQIPAASDLWDPPLGSGGRTDELWPRLWPADPTEPSLFAAAPPISTASCGAPRSAICPCNIRRNFASSPISRPRKRSGSRCRNRLSAAPMR